MKRITVLISILICQISLSQEVEDINLAGEWKFVELQDKDGKKQTKIPLNRWQKNSIENVNRDSYIFHKNGKYISSNPYNTSNGTWYFDKTTNEINLELQIDPKDPFLKSLEEHNLITKRKDGFYYQKAVKKLILDFTKNSMTIKDRDEYVLIYKRIDS